MDFLFNTIWGWLGIGGTVIAVALAVAYFFPPFRNLAITIAAGAAGVLAIYAKGASDAKRREREKREAVVAKAQADYSKIDARPDDAGTVERKLRNGDF